MRLRSTLSLAALAALPAALSAQGFQVNEHGTCVMGRAGTGVAASCADGSAMFYNPAGLAGMRGVTVSAGATVIAPFGDFTDDLTGDVTGLANDPIPVPHVYVSYGVTDRVAAGIGVFVPYGLGTKWPATFEGRFNGYDNSLFSIYVQPTVAFQAHERVAIGAGFDVAIGSVKLTQRVDLSEFEAAPGITFGQLGIPFHTDFANALLESSGAIGYGGHVGVQLRPVDRLRLGLRYLSRVTLDYEGDVTFDQVLTNIILPPGNPLSAALMLPGDQPLPLDSVITAANLFAAGRPLADSTATTSITMPDQFGAGFALDVTPRLTLLGDWHWVHWTVFDTLTIAFDNDATPDDEVVENYRNTNAFRAGLEYAASDRVTLRGGYLYHQAASPEENVTPLLPEANRNEATAGIGLRLSDQLRLDVGYQYIRQDKRRGRVREVPPGVSPQTVVDQYNSGLYTFGAHLAAATITVSF